MINARSRRQFLKDTAVATGVALYSSPILLAAADAVPPRMKLCLSPGAIGVKAPPRELVALALKHGFDAVEPPSDFLASLGAAELAEFRAAMKALAWGAAGFPVDFRGDDEKFRASLDDLLAKAAALKRAGVECVSTWLSPASNDVSRAENFQRHATRLRESAKILRDHGLRLGLEYVGTPALREGRKHPFIYNMRGTRELIAEIDTGNVGLVLDSWHWWISGDTEQDIAALTPRDIISVDLNDAPAGIPIEKQQDGRRELPAATGVIPVTKFLNGLRRISYSGPVRAEPFNKPLNDMEDAAACAAVITALRKAVAL